MKKFKTTLNSVLFLLLGFTAFGPSKVTTGVLAGLPVSISLLIRLRFLNQEVIISVIPAILLLIQKRLFLQQLYRIAMVTFCFIVQINLFLTVLINKLVILAWLIMAAIMVLWKLLKYRPTPFVIIFFTVRDQ